MGTRSHLRMESPQPAQAWDLDAGHSSQAPRPAAALSPSQDQNLALLTSGRETSRPAHAPAPWGLAWGRGLRREAGLGELDPHPSTGPGGPRRTVTGPCCREETQGLPGLPNLPGSWENRGASKGPCHGAATSVAGCRERAGVPRRPPRVSCACCDLWA